MCCCSGKAGGAGIPDGKLIEAQEEECKRIARELHDDFNQRLAALSVELESMERTPIAPPGPMARQLAAIRAQVGHLSDDLHDLAYRLHPSLLEHVGLEVALRDHVAEFTKRTGLPVTFDAREVPADALAGDCHQSVSRDARESAECVQACPGDQGHRQVERLVQWDRLVGAR